MKVCKSHGKRWCATCLFATIAYPVEHVVWELTPLRHILHLVGL